MNPPTYLPTYLPDFKMLLTFATNSNELNDGALLLVEFRFFKKLDNLV